MRLKPDVKMEGYCFGRSARLMATQFVIPAQAAGGRPRFTAASSQARLSEADVTELKMIDAELIVKKKTNSRVRTLTGRSAAASFSRLANFVTDLSLSLKT